MTDVAEILQSPEDQLATLKAKREALTEEASELHAALAPVGENALEKKSRIEVELRALSASEAAAVQAWVRGDRSAPPPQPDRERRKELRRELATIDDDIEEQKSVQAALAVASEEYARLYGGISHEIDRVVLEISAKRVEEDFLAAIEAHNAATAAMARLDAWSDALGGLRDGFVGSRKPGLAQQVNTILQNVSARRDIPPDDRARHGFRTAFERDLARLRA